MLGPLLLLFFAVVSWYQQKKLPQRVSDHYFAISSSSLSSNWVGMLLAPLTFQDNWLVYLPVLAVIQHSTRFLKFWELPLLCLINTCLQSCLGKHLVHERVSKY